MSHHARNRQMQGADLYEDQNDLFQVCMVLQARIDYVWERLLLIHTGIITVMVFLAERPASDTDVYVVTRCAIFAFYTVALIIAARSMWDSYLGLQAGLSDLQREKGEDGRFSALEGWMLGLNNKSNPQRRILMLLIAWGLLGYLLFWPVYEDLRTKFSTEASATVKTQ